MKAAHLYAEYTGTRRTSVIFQGVPMNLTVQFADVSAVISKAGIAPRGRCPTDNNDPEFPRHANTLRRDILDYR